MLAGVFLQKITSQELLGEVASTAVRLASIDRSGAGGARGQSITMASGHLRCWVNLMGAGRWTGGPQDSTGN